jgi:hypothetical protein
MSGQVTNHRLANITQNVPTASDSPSSFFSLHYWMERPLMSIGVIILIVTVVVLVIHYLGWFKGTFVDRWFQNFKGWLTPVKSGN